MDHNFYQVEYKGKKGWVGSTYVVRNTLEIVLMESNVPAYILRRMCEAKRSARSAK